MYNLVSIVKIPLVYAISMMLVLIDFIVDEYEVALLMKLS